MGKYYEISTQGVTGDGPEFPVKSSVVIGVTVYHTSRVKWVNGMCSNLANALGPCTLLNCNSFKCHRNHLYKTTKYRQLIITGSYLD